jgi:hypothetical protein
MSEYAVPISLLSAAAFVDLLACKVPSPNPAVSTLAQGDESVSSSEPRGRQAAEFESHEASGLPQKHELLTLYNGEPTIPQVHYYHDDIDVSARFCYSLGGSFKSTLGGSLAR